MKEMAACLKIIYVTSHSETPGKLNAKFPLPLTWSLTSPPPPPPRFGSSNVLTLLFILSCVCCFLELYLLLFLTL